MVDDGSLQDFASIKGRLDEIAEMVNDEALSLDTVLDLYEEAIALGTKAASLLEEGVLEEVESGEADSSPEAS